jgi:[acyl-carrier-protein] S-malonyltransferase
LRDNDCVGTAPSRPIALLLPGQGSQHPGMAVELYGGDPVFTSVIDRFFEAIGAAGRRLRADWLAGDPHNCLDDASSAQPLLFAIGCALGHSLLTAGVRPSVLLGHSVGELAAAALADVFDLEAGAGLLAARSAAMAEASPGGMLAVRATAAELAPYLDADGADGVVVGALNAPRQTVLSGPDPRLAEVEQILRAAGLWCRRVRARQPFHSPVLGDAAVRFAEAFAEIGLRAPSIPIQSTRTAALVDPRQAVDPSFWAGQLAAPVLFWPALDNLLAADDYLLVEAGPGQGLSTLARRHPSVRAGRSAVVSLLPAGAADSLRTWQVAVDSLTAQRPHRQSGDLTAVNVWRGRSN